MGLNSPTNESGRRGRDVLATVAFLVALPALCQFLFSSLGFNPTDDGFTLAYARRLLSGEVPHRDFIIIRPALSPLLHVPVVRWGGDHTYWISRGVVWLEFACIAVLWVWILQRVLRRSLWPVEKAALALIGLAASANTFPIMAWHSIDGLFLTSLGIAASAGATPNRKLLGYGLIGAAALCKQSFVFLVPATLIVLGDFRQARYWAAAATPAIFYAVFLAGTGAAEDGVAQLTSQKGLLTVGGIAYLNPAMLLGLIGGFAIPFPRPGSWARRVAGPGLFIVASVASAAALGSDRFVTCSFALMGAVTGLAARALLERRDERDGRDVARAAALVVMVAWSVSLSFGYNSPLLATGQLLGFVGIYMAPPPERVYARRLYALALAVCAIGVLGSFVSARTHAIYREQPGARLTYRLDGVVPGARWINTNGNTGAFLADLQHITVRVAASGKTYVILPDCAAWWVQSVQRNPLPIDWVQGTELNKAAFVDRVTRRLETVRRTNVVIVQKVEAERLADGYVPLSSRYAVVEYVRNRFRKISETPLFELYE